MKPSGPTSRLRLIAQDADDLAVMAAACQDGLVRVGDMHFQRTERRFSAILSRFRWEAATARGPYERVRAALSFDSVLAVQTKRVRRDAPEAVASVLTLRFEPAGEPPGGRVLITLAGGGEIGLDVECLEGLLVDLGPVWPTPNRPDHDRG